MARNTVCIVEENIEPPRLNSSAPAQHRHSTIAWDGYHRPEGDILRGGYKLIAVLNAVAGGGDTVCEALTAAFSGAVRGYRPYLRRLGTEQGKNK